MAPVKGRSKKASQSARIKLNVTKAWDLALKCLVDPSYTWRLCYLLILGEIILNVLIVQFVSYTEIDWLAYMQEVGGFLNGTRDYMQLKGDTGPLVYPAGFVYVYSLLYHVTSEGANIKLAQYVFCVFYIINLVMIVRIYEKTRQCPPYVFIFMCFTSYRIHSIFVLRLFNDPVAMMLLYASVNLFISKQWMVGCAMFSLAVSIKMNILLFAPGLLILLLVDNGILKTAGNLFLCLLVQIALAMPFLLENPLGYLVRSFDLGRQFFYIWTVNWRLIPEEIFVDKRFQLLLLALHLITLLLFAVYRWRGGLKNLFLLINPVKNWKPFLMPVTSNDTVLVLFTSNFVGMCFSRSLHYQFYVWYYHTLPFLLWSTKFNVPTRLLIFGLIELSWNTYPSTFLSSLTLHVLHLLLLLGLWFVPVEHEKKVEKLE